MKQAGSISFSYSPLGLRQSKQFSALSGNTKEWYIHDATGNIMCIYDSLSSNSIICKERPLYGSSRLGIDNKEITVNSGNWGTLPDTNRFRGYCGYRNFELSNHLGNVLTTFSDRKWGMDDNSNGIVDYYKPVVTSYTDYYPFGYPMPDRIWSGTDYRFGFNGQEKDNEIYGEGESYSFEFRNYDTRLGRFWSVDPLTKDYPYWTPYQFAGNTPIWARELEGLETWYTTNSNGEQELLEGVSGPLSNSSIKEFGATHYGIMENVSLYSFSNQEIQNFAQWNETQGSKEPGKCLGAAITGSEILTGANAGFRDLKGKNVMNGKSVYDLGNNLVKAGNATEIRTSQGQEIASIKNNPNNANAENTAYIAGPGGGYHSLIIVYNVSDSNFSLYDQGTGWDVKNVSQQEAQSPLNSIDNTYPTWGTKVWQIYKSKQELILHPINIITE